MLRSKAYERRTEAHERSGRDSDDPRDFADLK
jgi:hypothetical protein